MKFNPLFFLCLSLLTGCFSENPIVGSGRIEVKEQETTEFEHIIFNSPYGRLYIMQGDKNTVKIEAEDNLINYFSTEVKDKILTIKTDKHKQFENSKPIKIFITIRDVQSIDLNGSGSLQSLGLIKSEHLNVKLIGSGSASLDVNGQQLDVKIVGSGHVNIKGEIANQIVEIKGSGSYAGQDLLSKNVHVIVNGSGDAIINAHDHLKAEMYGSGMIRYKGHPKIEEMIEGTGSITAID